MSIWDYIHVETGLETHVIKMVVFAMILGLNVVKVACEHQLTIDDMVAIRMAFDDFALGVTE